MKRCKCSFNVIDAGVATAAADESTCSKYITEFLWMIVISVRFVVFFLSLSLYTFISISIRPIDVSQLVCVQRDSTQCFSINNRSVK